MTVIVGSAYPIHFPKHATSETGSVATVSCNSSAELGPC
jgi:hypothetical protein